MNVIKAIITKFKKLSNEYLLPVINYPAKRIVLKSKQKPFTGGRGLSTFLRESRFEDL